MRIFKRKKQKRTNDQVIIDCASFVNFWVNKAEYYFTQLKNTEKPEITQFYSRKIKRIHRHALRLRVIQSKAQIGK